VLPHVRGQYPQFHFNPGIERLNPPHQIISLLR
jgi:hypothetical protein